MCRQVLAAADACRLAGSSGMQLQPAAASRYEHNLDQCSLDSQHLAACKGFALMHFNLQSALHAAWLNALQSTGASANYLIAGLQRGPGAEPGQMAAAAGAARVAARGRPGGGDAAGRVVPPNAGWALRHRRMRLLQVSSR